jgi:uncharacterized protein DUF87
MLRGTETTLALLELAPHVKLQAEQFLQRFGILAMSGAGKSNTAVVMAEELFEAGVPWVAIDPKGDWWGIRSGADGKSDGLAVPVFGGLHGDLPLEETAGREVAELIADTRLTCILDVSEFSSKAAQLRFLTDFAETLLRKNRDPLMLFCEEADEYLPQRPQKNEARCVGAWAKLVKRGRFRGIFVTLITQRSASLSKDALNQVDTLIPMRMAAPRDKKAIEEWVVSHGKGRDLVDSLPGLDDGEAWLWSPHKLHLMERLRFRRRRTFDSGGTPTLKGSRPPAKLADVDLDAIKDKMAKAVAQAEQEDPKKLRDQIKKLQGELAKKQGEPKEVKVEVPREVPVVPNKLKADIIDLLTRVKTKAQNEAERVTEQTDHIIGCIENGVWDPATWHGVTRVELKEEPQKKIRRPDPPAPKTERASGISEDRNIPDRNTGNPDAELPKGAAKMLETLVARHPMKLSRSQLATLSGYSVKSSTVSSSLTALRNDGMIEEANGLISPSQAGFEWVGEVPAAPTSAELLETWRNALTAGARAFFEALEESYPVRLSRAELAERAGYSISSSTVSSSLTTLRRNGLLDESDLGMCLVSELFE